MQVEQDSVTRDRSFVTGQMSHAPDTESVARFKPGPGIERLALKFDIENLRAAYDEAKDKVEFLGVGIHALPLTRRPGDETITANDMSGRYYLRPDDSYLEVAREDPVDEAAFTEFAPELKGSYFEYVHTQLTARFAIGRMRVLAKDPFSCNSWHRDPEPRLHIPIVTNPGSLFIVNHHVTHLPADGSVYFTDTRGYHTALNGGDNPRVHIVAALPN